MKWIEERDALIAQTKAFVEAVSRRSADSGRLAATPVQPAAVATRVQPAAVARSSAPPAPATPATRISASPPLVVPVTRTSAPPAPVAPVAKASVQPAPAMPAPAAKANASPLPATPAAAPKASEATRALPTLAPLARKFDQDSMSSEIRARIAAFRAHQERFNRERHEYFNATLARLRAEINELPEPVRRQTDSNGKGRGPDLMPDQSRKPAAGAPPLRRPEGRT